MEDEHDNAALWGLLAGGATFGVGLYVLRRSFGAGVTSGPAFDAALALAKRWGGVFGLNPLDTLAIMSLESSFDPSMVNHTPRAEAVGGAWGLMQITPPTAQSLAALLGRVRSDIDAPAWSRYGTPQRAAVELTLRTYTGDPHSLLDANLNAMLGTYYLARLTAEFTDFDRVAMAYQQGPQRVRNKRVGPLGEQYAEMALTRRARLAERNVV